MVGVASSTTQVVYSAQAWAAATSLTGAALINDGGVGTVSSFLVNLTAYTPGSSTGLDVFLQYSPDGGTTWISIWQCEALTATGTAYIPPIYIPGRYRMAYVNRGAAATTATVTVTATRLNMATGSVVRQYFDRTVAVVNGSTALVATGAYDVTGCNVLTASVTVTSKATTTDPTYQIQTSADGVNWAAAGSPTTTLVVGTNDLVFTNNTKRFARVIVVTAGTGTAQVGSVVALTASN